MTYKILEGLGVENENIDGAAFNNFAAGGKDCIIKGVLNECEVRYSTSTGASRIIVETGELLIHGFRVKILSPYEFSPSHTLTKYSIRARITLSSDKFVSFNLYTQNSDAPFQKDDLFKSSKGGVYEVELAKYQVYVGSSGTQHFVQRTLDVISGVEGVDGQTPFIGNNGNWWIGEKDTGVSAEGKTPEKGVDYWTAEDKLEIVSEVLNSMTAAEGVKF